MPSGRVTRPAQADAQRIRNIQIHIRGIDGDAGQPIFRLLKPEGSVPIPAIPPGEGAIAGPVFTAVQSIIFHDIMEKASCDSNVCRWGSVPPQRMTCILGLITPGAFRVHCPFPTFLLILSCSFSFDPGQVVVRRGKEGCPGRYSKQTVPSQRANVQCYRKNRLLLNTFFLPPT